MTTDLTNIPEKNAQGLPNIIYFEEIINGQQYFIGCHYSKSISRFGCVAVIDLNNMQKEKIITDDYGIEHQFETDALIFDETLQKYIGSCISGGTPKKYFIASI